MVKKQGRHPYETLRSFAAGLLLIGLVNWAKKFGECVGRVLDGEMPSSLLYYAAFAQPIFWILVLGVAWLITLLRPSGATPWLTSFILLLPYAWLISGWLWFTLLLFKVGRFKPELLLAQVVSMGLIYAYHRFAWMWWWRRRREPYPPQVLA